MRLIMLAGMTVFLLLSACGGGGSGAGGGGSGAGGGGTGTSGPSKTVAGYAYTIQSPSSSSPGELMYNAVYSDGSIGQEAVLVDVTPATSGNATMSLTQGKINGTTYLFVASGAAATVASYSLSGNGTSATLINSVSTGQVPMSLAVNSTGSVLYVGCMNGSIYTYSISSTGSLSPLQSPAFTACSYCDIVSIAIAPSGDYLIADSGISTTDSSFYQLNIGANGTLTQVGTPQTVTGWAYNLIANPSTSHGTYFYAGGTGDSNYFTIAATSSSISVTTNTTSVGEAFPVWIDPTGTWLSMLYSAPNTPTSTSMQQYTISSSGSLSVNGSEISVNSQGTVSSSLGGYDSTSGFVIVRAESNILVLGYNSLTGSLTLKNSGLGGNEGFAYLQMD